MGELKTWGIAPDVTIGVLQTSKSKTNLAAIFSNIVVVVRRIFKMRRMK
jgi:hypothetical protein